MLKQLLNILKGQPPLEVASRDFSRMLTLVVEMIGRSSDAFWGATLSPEQKTKLYEKDVEVNRLERTIRKAIVSHLAGANPSDAPYCLVMMSLVKDVERLGDYAKNLIEVTEFTQELPEDELTSELLEIRRSVETLAAAAPEIIATDDADRAHAMTEDGRNAAKRCDELIRKIAKSDYSAPVVVTMTLGTRFYKRIGGHFLNVLSSVLMPVHKLDYYDLETIERMKREG